MYFYVLIHALCVSVHFRAICKCYKFSFRSYIRRGGRISPSVKRQIQPRQHLLALRSVFIMVSQNSPYTCRQSVLFAKHLLCRHTPFNSDLRSLLKPTVGQSALTGERDARSAAYLFWVIIQPVLLSSDLNEIMQNTVVALKREGKQTFSSLATGQQGALQFALKPLRNVFARALVKAYAFKHRLRLEVLGTLRPFPIYDLLSSSLICPGLFPDSAWDEATNLLRQSMDSPSLRTWDNKAPPFNAPPPPARSRSFRDPLPSPSHRPPRQYTTPWRTDTSSTRNPRHTYTRDGSTTQAFRGRGARSARGYSSQPSRAPPHSTSSRQPPAHRGHSRGRANSRRHNNPRQNSRRSGSRGRAGSSSARRGRQSGRSF